MKASYPGPCPACHGPKRSGAPYCEECSTIEDGYYISSSGHINKPQRRPRYKAPVQGRTST